MNVKTKNALIAVAALVVQTALCANVVSRGQQMAAAQAAATTAEKAERSAAAVAAAATVPAAAATVTEPVTAVAVAPASALVAEPASAVVAEPPPPKAAAPVVAPPQSQQQMDAASRRCIEIARAKYPGIEWRDFLGVGSERFELLGKKGIRTAMEGSRGDKDFRISCFLANGAINPVYMLFSLHPITGEATQIQL